MGVARMLLQKPETYCTLSKERASRELEPPPTRDSRCKCHEEQTALDLHQSDQNHDDMENVQHTANPSHRDCDEKESALNDHPSADRQNEPLMDARPTAHPSHRHCDENENAPNDHQKTGLDTPAS